MTDEIYLLRHGKRVGPYPPGAIRSFLATRSISPEDLAWYEGLEDWMPVATLPILSEEAKPGRKPQTGIRERADPSPGPRLGSTRVARITEQNKMITGQHQLRRRSGAMGPLWVILGTILIVAAFLYVRSHFLHRSWSQEYGNALQTARDNNKLVVIFFTRPGTSPLSKKLESETFDQPEFRNFEAENLVMLTVNLDWPRYSDKEVRDIVQRFQVQSVPTLIVLNGQDEMLGRFGYREGGPPVWIAELGAFKP
jgi:hypothetical protein